MNKIDFGVIDSLMKVNEEIYENLENLRGYCCKLRSLIFVCFAVSIATAGVTVSLLIYKELI